MTRLPTSGATHTATVLTAFAAAGLLSAAIQPFGFRLAKAAMRGEGFLDLLLFLPLGSPSTLFTVCLLLTGALLWKTGKLRIVSTTQRVSWSCLTLLFSIPIGVGVSFFVFNMLEPPVTSDGPPIEPTFLQRYLGEFAIPIAIVVGGFAVLATCWLSIRVLCGASPKRFWLISAVTIFGTLLVTSTFNYCYLMFGPNVGRDSHFLLDPDLSRVDVVTFLFFVEIAGALTMLLFGQTAVGAAIGCWILGLTGTRHRAIHAGAETGIVNG